MLGNVVLVNLIRLLRICGQMYIRIVVSFWRRARAAFKYKNQCLEISDFISNLAPEH